MILHRYALDQDGDLVDIEDYSRATRPAGWAFRCPGCQGAMCARIGEIKVPHFAHQDSHALCAEEGYLIGLASSSIRAGFTAAKAAGEPYHLTFRRQGICTRPQAIGLSPCSYSETDRRDLTRFRDHCESVADGRAGDLVIARQDGKHPLRVALWVTRRGREALPTDGSRWVEIRVTDEDAAFQLADGLDLTRSDTRHVGLDLARYQLGDCDGRCRCQRQVRCLMVYRSGKIRGADLAMEAAISARDEVAKGGLRVEEGSTLRMNAWVANAVKDILDSCPTVMNCHVCTRRTIADAHLSCSRGHTPSTWNAAATCPDFERHASTAELRAQDEVLYRQDGERRLTRVPPAPVPDPEPPEPQRAEDLRPPPFFKPPPHESLCLFGMSLEESLRYAQEITVDQVQDQSEDIQRRIVGCWGYIGLVIDDLPFSLTDFYERGARLGRSALMSGR